MQRSFLGFVFPLAFPAIVIVACGSRSGLDAPDLHDGAPIDGTMSDVRMDGPAFDGPLFEGGALDVVTDCGQPAYCDPNDLGYVWQCGVRVFQCSSLEQCATQNGISKCVNPCVDTLGQDTSNGCEFYIAPIDITDQADGACYAVYIVNQWKTGETAKIQVDRGGQMLNVDTFARIPSGKGTSISYGAYSNAQGLGKDQIAILFLSRDPNAMGQPTDPKVLAPCPMGVTAAVSGDPSVHGIGKGQAFHIKTNVPVVAYDIIPYGGGRSRIASASLLLPTNVWDVNYPVFNAYPGPTFSDPRTGPELQIYAKENGTTVWLKPNTFVNGGGGLPAAPANQSTKYTLNAGEYLQFLQSTEFSGSAIESDKPVAVIGGSSLYQVPVGRQRADGGHQMLFPVSALGSEYVGVRFRSRNVNFPESVPWRFVGIVNGTQLSYEPSTPSGAPTSLNAGDITEFTAPGPFVVRSQDANHPFAFGQYMVGGEFFDGEGDPEFINVLAPAQYLPRYTFFTDPTYPETNLVIVRAKDPMLGMPNVKLDCLGTVSNWTAIGNSGVYEFARVDLSKDNWNAVGNCDNGVHTIEGTFTGADGGPVGQAKIAVTVWGWGSPRTYSGSDETNPLSTRWVSYGYTAGANITVLNNAKLPAK